MMKHIGLVSIVLVLSLWSLSGAEWSAELAKPERWAENSSGKMVISGDPAEAGAVRFDVEIADGVDPWVYPGFALKEGESLAGIGGLRFEAKAEAAGGRSRFACVMINDKMLAFAMPVGKWEKVDVPFPSGSDFDPGRAKLFRIGFNPAESGKSTFWIRNFEIVPAAATLSAAEAAAVPVFCAVESDAPSHVFYDHEKTVFRLKEPYRQSDCKYRVQDGFGREIAVGKWPERGAGELVLEKLPRGYYTLELSSEAAPGFREPLSFAVVAATDPNPASFFGMDTAQSWLSGPNAGNERFPGEAYELVSELCRRAGFGVVRERLAWAETEPRPGEFNWGKYLRNAEYLSARGVRVNGLYHDSAPWAKTKSAKMPDDLLAVYQFSRQAGETFVGKMISWEFWNEPDGHPSDPAWDLAAATKAAVLGFKAANPDLLVLNSSFCMFPLRSFTMTTLENDLLDYVDVFNFHIYNSLTEYPEIIGHLREVLTTFGEAEMPIWITENGTRVEGMGSVNSYRAGLRAHSPAQEMLVAEFVPKGQILLQSLGVARDFFFVLTPYNEAAGQKDWGLMRQDQTVKPGYVAFANLNHQLARASLAGEVFPADGVRAFLFDQPDGTQTLVMWSESVVDRTGATGEEVAVEIEQPDGKYPAADLFGRVSEVSSDGGRIRLSATRYPFFINNLRGLTADRAAVSAGKAEPGRERSNIVLRAVTGEGFRVTDTKEAADLSGDSGKLTLQVWNLSPEEERGIITLHGAKVSGLPENVTIPAFGKQEFELTITPDFPEGSFKGMLEFGGEFNGKPVSALAIPLLRVAELLTGDGLELDYRNPGRWRANASGDMEIAYVETEDAIRFRTVFKPGTDRWIYPEYLLNLPKESLKNAAGVSFEIRAESEDIAPGVSFTALMAVLDTVKEHGKAYWLPFPATTDQWQTRVILFSNLDTAEIRMLRIGMNPKRDDFTYYIRNLKVFYDGSREGENAE